MPDDLGERLVSRVVLLAGSMRAAGAPVGVGELLGAHRALAAVDPTDRVAVYHALRASLCARREDLAAFDAAFAACFAHVVRRASAPPVLDEVASLVLPTTAVPGAPAAVPFDAATEVVPAAWSDAELLRDKDFADYTDDERRVRRLRPRRLVLVCDVSGSMTPYARMLLQYLQAAVAAHRRVEAFAFGTRLTRITRELAERDPDRALERAAAAVEDWSGGTRIGEALAMLNREHGRRLGRGAVVVLLSDGWDRGEPELLAAEMARLRRSAHRVIWLNPLKAHPGYEPLARGMAAALPHADHFLAGSSLRSLEELAALLGEGLE